MQLKEDLIKPIVTNCDLTIENILILPIQSNHYNPSIFNSLNHRIRKMRRLLLRLQIYNY